MSEFGCDDWCLTNINQGVVKFKCPKICDRDPAGGYLPHSEFNSADRMRLAVEMVGCSSCKYNKERKLGGRAIKSPYEPRPITDLK